MWISQSIMILLESYFIVFRIMPRPTMLKYKRGGKKRGGTLRRKSVDKRRTQKKYKKREAKYYYF